MDWESYLRFLLALVFVLGLLGLLAWALKRFAPSLASGLASRSPGPGQRLQILEIRPLDAKRKLVLLRHDQEEHLILIGGAQEIVIAAGREAVAPDLRLLENDRQRAVPKGRAAS